MVTYWDKSATMTSKSYIEDWLKQLVSNIMKQRPVSGTKKLKFHHDNARPSTCCSKLNNFLKSTLS